MQVQHSRDTKEHLVCKPHATHIQTLTYPHEYSSSVLFSCSTQRQSMKAVAADCLEQAQLLQEYHLVVLTCIAGHSSAHKDQDQRIKSLHFIIIVTFFTFIPNVDLCPLCNLTIALRCLHQRPQTDRQTDGH